MRTFKIYSPSSFQIYDAVLLLTMVTMLYITSPGPIYFITGSLYTLTTFTHFTHTPPLASGNCQSVPFFYEFGDFFFFSDSTYERLPWQSSGWDFALPMQGRGEAGRGAGSIPGQGTGIRVQHGAAKKKKIPHVSDII